MSETVLCESNSTIERTDNTPIVLPQLHTLTLNKCFEENNTGNFNNDNADGVLHGILAHTKHVTTLNLTYNTLLRGYSLIDLPASIRVLNLALCRRIDGQIMDIVLQSLSQLEVLSVYR